MGAAPMAYALWRKHLAIDPAKPDWWNRDRFVLSAGHGSMLLYSLMHLSGFKLSIEDIKKFRQLGSQTPGHPERFITKGVEATTGPLGQGTANAVGMAMAERFLADKYNKPKFKLFDHYTYALVSDGDLMEGVACEAAAIAGHLKLGKLIYLYDANDVTLDGPAELSFTENIAMRYESQGWHVQTITDGDENVDAISDAVAAAKKSSQPSLIIVKTTIGYGSPGKQGSSSSHGSPLGDSEIDATRKALGWSHKPFEIPKDVYQDFAAIGAEGGAKRKDWDATWQRYQDTYPTQAAELKQAFAGEVPALEFEVPAKTEATRVTSGAIMQEIAKQLPTFFGGDADLGCSTKTLLKGEADFAGTGSGRNIRFGVREHAMASICNGLSYHGGIRPYASTFFVFSDYMRPAVRLAAMNHLPVTYVWTHDSVALGEDGPTHQPVEHLMSLRAMPGLAVVRPADANETIGAWKYALQRNSGPTALVLSRQNLPVLENAQQDISKGAYTLLKTQGAKALIIATGSEVSLALAAADVLNSENIPTNVVSMPCWEAFLMQTPEYQEEVLPSSILARVSVEAGATHGWHRFLGLRGEAIGIDRFGISAPGAQALAWLGLVEENVVAAVRRQLS